MHRRLGNPKLIRRGGTIWAHWVGRIDSHDESVSLAETSGAHESLGCRLATFLFDELRQGSTAPTLMELLMLLIDASLPHPHKSLISLAHVYLAVVGWFVRLWITVVAPLVVSIEEVPWLLDSNRSLWLTSHLVSLHIESVRLSGAYQVSHLYGLLPICL
jgi:hypothetical protein